jgi:hypothetical protein
MTQQSGGMNVGEQIVAFLRRIATSDFRIERPTSWERARLEKQGIVNPLAQKYAAWRASLLYFSAACVLFGAIWGLATIELIEDDVMPANQLFRLDGDPGVINGFQIVSSVFVLLGALTVCVSAPLWNRVRLSRLLARTGWMVMFVAPLVLYVVPIASSISIESRLADPGVETFAKLLDFVLIKLGIAAFVLLKIGPRWLALMPGIIRSSMTLKTLMPEARGPGWTVVLLAPLFSVLLLVILAVVNQLEGNALLILGVIFMMVAPLVYVIRAKSVVRPCRPEDVGAAVAWPRRIAFIVGTLGFVLLLIWAFDKFDAGDVIAFAISTIGSVLLMMVVGADFILPLLRSSQASTKSFVASPLCGALDERCEQLADVLEKRTPLSGALSATPTVVARPVDQAPPKQVESVEARPVDPEAPDQQE